MPLVLSENALSQQEFKLELEQALASRFTVDHPLVEELSKSEKNIQLLRLTATQGYQLTKIFARYIAGLYYNCPLPKFKRRLAVNLYEEETGNLSKTDGHLELMQRFVLALGITPEELEAVEPLPNTLELIEYRRKLVEDPTQFHKAAAAVMIASEGQSLESKAGKMRHQLIPAEYKLTDYELTFFAVHAAEDVGHVRDGIELVTAYCTTRKMQLEAIEAIHETCTRFWQFYEGILQAAKSV